MAGNKNSGRKNYSQELARHEALKKAWQIVEHNLNKKKDIKIALPIVLKDLGNKQDNAGNQTLIVQIASPLQDRYKLEMKEQKIVEGKLVENKEELPIKTEINTLETTPTPLCDNTYEKVDTVLDIFPNIETNNLANTSNDTNDSSIGNNEGQP